MGGFYDDGRCRVVNGRCRVVNLFYQNQFVLGQFIYNTSFYIQNVRFSPLVGWGWVWCVEFLGQHLSTIRRSILAGLARRF